jgi:hypothetical protein
MHDDKHREAARLRKLLGEKKLREMDREERALVAHAAMKWAHSLQSAGRCAECTGCGNPAACFKAPANLMRSHVLRSEAPVSDALAKLDKAIIHEGNVPGGVVPWTLARALLIEAVSAAGAKSATAAIDPRMLTLIRVLDDLEESGNGWNPATMPANANEAERKFRDMLVTNWRAIRALIPLRRAESRIKEKS